MRSWRLLLDLRAGCGWPSGFEDDLLAVVLLVLEDLEAAFRLGERQAVGDDPGRIDLSALDALQKRLHVALHVALPGTQGPRPVHPRPGGKLVQQTAVHADHRDHAAAAARQDRLAQRVRAFGLRPD